jgi:hypothetical protein
MGEEIEAGIFVQENAEIYGGKEFRNYWDDLGKLLKPKYLPFSIFGTKKLADKLKIYYYENGLDGYPFVEVGRGGGLTSRYLGINKGDRIDVSRPSKMLTANGVYKKLEGEKFLEMFFYENSEKQIDMIINNNSNDLVVTDDVVASGATLAAVNQKINGRKKIKSALVPVTKIKKSPYRNIDGSLEYCDLVTVISVIPPTKELENEITLWETLRFLDNYSDNAEFISRYFKDVESAIKIIKEMKRYSQGIDIPDEWR